VIEGPKGNTRRVTTKWLIPDTHAIVHWLNNRRGAYWKNREELSVDFPDLAQSLLDARARLQGRIEQPKLMSPQGKEVIEKPSKTKGSKAKTERPLDERLAEARNKLDNIRKRNGRPERLI
jgi:hypothetical protein